MIGSVTEPPGFAVNIESATYNYSEQIWRGLNLLRRRSDASVRLGCGTDHGGRLLREFVKCRAAQLVRTMEPLSKQVQVSLGEIVSLLMRSPQFRNMTLTDLRNFVVPAVTSEQFMIAETRSKSSGLFTPVAAVLWASVSKEVDRRLSENLDQLVRLAPKEWKSGDIPWLIIATGNQRLIEALLQRLQKTVLKGRPLKSRVAGKDGKALATAMAP